MITHIYKNVTDEEKIRIYETLLLKLAKKEEKRNEKNSDLCETITRQKRQFKY